MTDTPMTPEYEREIRSHVAEMSDYTLGNAFARDLLAEVDRLRARVAELEARPTHAEVLNEAAEHFDATSEGRFVKRYFGHQVAAELRALPAALEGSPETEVTQ
jgi:uncharacterized protein YgbK (DUF1537 family)